MKQSTESISGVLTLSGYGVRVWIERSHLCIEDGIGDERRHFRFARVPRAIKRLVILGHSGIISLEALRWLHDTEAAFVQIDHDGEVIVAAGPSGLNDARLRRAQAMAMTTGLGLTIMRGLIADKLRGQATVMERLPLPERDCRDLSVCLEELNRTASFSEIRFIEARFANMYWSAWSDVEVKFSAKDKERIPEHWLKFGQRRSLISQPSPRRATDPANAIFNYLYAILEAEARIAALRMGLDPGLGFGHADQRSRDSLPCDLMEPVRPKVDAFLLDLLSSRTFKKNDFFETREGICRIMPPLTHQLAEAGTLWAKELQTLV